MDLSANLLIIVGIIIVLLGIFAGMLLSTLKEDGEPEEEMVEQAPPGGRKGHYTPVARFWHERSSGALVVEMDGKSYISPEPMSEDQRARLESTARELRAWLGMGIVTAPEESHSAAAPASYAPASSTPPVSPASGAAPANSPPAAPYGGAPAPAVPYTTAHAVRPAAHAAAPVSFDLPAPVTSGKSIVMQIEDILQDMISGTPLARRGLHLLEDPVKGVVVQVETSYYEGIDAVPEPDIKATIRAAVAAWEDSQ